MRPLLAAFLVACSPSDNDDSEQGDTGGPSDTAAEWATGAYAEVALTFAPLSGESSSWSFRLEDGDPNSGSRYADEVSVGHYNTDDDDVEVFRASHNGCPDSTGGENPADRPLRFWVWTGSSDGSRVLLELAAEVCDEDEDDLACYWADRESWSSQSFEFEDSGDLRQGTLSGELYCLDDGIDGDYTGRVSVSMDFVARFEE